MSGTEITPELPLLDMLQENAQALSRLIGGDADSCDQLRQGIKQRIQNRFIGLLLIAATLPLSCIADVCVYKPPSVRHVADTVVDSTGQPIPGVKIAIIRGGEPVATATTDDSGRFRFDSLKQGTYELAATAVGFQSAYYKILLNHSSLHWDRSLQIELAIGFRNAEEISKSSRRNRAKPAKCISEVESLAMWTLRPNYWQVSDKRDSLEAR